MIMMFSDINLKDEIPSVPAGSIIVEDDFVNELKIYNQKSKMNSMKKEEYRNRMNKLYEEIGMIVPVDAEINSVLYFDDYEECGLSLNKKDISLRQLWTEYRLIYNEKKREDDNVMTNSFVLDNFDDLFDRVTKKVDGLDKYIGDLNSLKKQVDVRSADLINDRENFEIEKVKFENYRREECARLEKKEKELNEKLEKLNQLMNSFENKMNTINN